MFSRHCVRWWGRWWKKPRDLWNLKSWRQMSSSKMDMLNRSGKRLLLRCKLWSFGDCLNSRIASKKRENCQNQWATSTMGMGELVHIICSRFLVGPSTDYWIPIFKVWIKEGQEPQKSIHWQITKAKKKSFQEEVNKSVKCHIPWRRKFGKLYLISEFPKCSFGRVVP